jgi:uncharacterized membrane protein
MNKRLKVIYRKAAKESQISYFEKYISILKNSKNDFDLKLSEKEEESLDSLIKYFEAQLNDLS